MCGLNIGYYLAKQGKNVIVLDKDEIGQKASGNKTGFKDLDTYILN